MKRCVIVGGADIGRYDKIRAALRPEDYLIFCDCGLRHLAALCREPDLIVGDFDSHPNPGLETETIVLPRVKDDTDTVFAAKEALRRGFDTFLLIGVIGARLDHTLGNVALLSYLDKRGASARILDDYSEMELVGAQPVAIPDSFSYFSLLNISGQAEGIDVDNAKYPLRGAVIPTDYPYGISNEVLPGQTAHVSVARGRLLLIKVD